MIYVAWLVLLFNIFQFLYGVWELVTCKVEWQQWVWLFWAIIPAVLAISLSIRFIQIS